MYMVAEYFVLLL